MNEQLSTLASLVSGQLDGDSHTPIHALSAIAQANDTTLVFAEDEKNFQLAQASSAAAILTKSNLGPTDKPLILVDNPKLAFVQLLKHFYTPPKRKASIHPTACIADDVVMGESCYIGAYVVIESGCVLGDEVCLHNHVSLSNNVTLNDRVTLHPKVTVYHDCAIGHDVTVHAGTVIGSDGFGYVFAQGCHQKMPHVGQVLIEDDVEIGANSTIDRATFGATLIKKGTKVDNLVQIAHSVELGEHNLLCAFTGIGGSSTSGNYVTFAGDVGISDHVVIEDQVTIGAGSGVAPQKTLKAGQVYFGRPARPMQKAIETGIATTRIPAMRKQLKALQKQVKELEKRLVE